MTLILYAQRRGWPLEGVIIELSHERVHSRDCQECDVKEDTMLDLVRSYITLKGDLAGDQRQRLLEISRRCPVHRTLEGSMKILEEMDVVN